MNRRKAFACLPICVCLLMTAAQSRAQDGMPPAPVRVGTAIKQTVQSHQLVIGNIVAAKRSRVAAELPGRVLNSPPEEGRSVKAGDVLVETDTTLLKLARTAMEAQLEQIKALQSQRKAVINQMQRQAEYLKKLTERNATPEKEFNDAQDNVLAAQAALAQADASQAQITQQLTELDEQIKRMVIKAPFDGVIVKKQTEAGEWLESGAIVAELVQTAPIDAVFDAPEAIVNKIKPGIQVPMKLRGITEQREGVIDRVVPEVDRITRTFPVIVRLLNKDGLLKPGMTAEVLAPSGTEQEAITVPRDAVRQTAQGAMIFVNRGGVGAAVPVTILFEIPGRFAIQGDVQDGEQVVIEGNERLFPGQPLAVLPDLQAKP